MGYRIGKDELERMIYELEKLSRERIAAEVRLSRDLITELRRVALPPKARLLLDRIPKQNEVEAWERLTAAPANAPGTDVVLSAEDFMRKDFE